MSSRYLVLVSCKGGEDFFLLAPRYFDDVKRAPKLGRHLFEFVWRDPEVTMRLLKTHRSLSRLCGRVLERPARDGANPKGSHELEARQPVQPFRVPLPEGRVLRRDTYNGVLHNRVAKVVNHSRDGEDAA